MVFHIFLIIAREKPVTVCCEAVKAEIVAVNEPRTLKIIVPQGVVSGNKYTLKVVTQTSAKYSSNILKNLREARSDIVLSIE